MSKLSLKYIEDLKLKHSDSLGSMRRLNWIENDLRQLDCFESKTGISLSVLLQAFISGICYRDGNIINHSHHLALTDSNECFEFRVLEEAFSGNPLFTLKLSDYGKTWALVGEKNKLLKEVLE